MKKLFLTCVLTALTAMKMTAEVDPNFYIYLCFGQSNMEGNAQPESVDKSGVDKRFQLLATCNYSSPSRTLGKWYTATPPLVNPNGGLGPTDYFGRTMVAALPANVKIGVIPVAMGGSPIEMFDKDKYQQKLKDNPNEWWATLAKNHYGGNPYGRLIEMGKKAQEVGVIKGILLHQGCSNNGDPNWPNMVKKIYNDMLNDLGLAADTVPLFVGETLRQENGGACYGHNVQVARMPSVVPTSHVISSEGLPGNGNDPWHFNATGYRILGKRYAFAALSLMGRELKADSAYQMSNSLKKFYCAKSITVDKEIVGMPGLTIPVKATFQDGHTEDVTSDMTFELVDGNVVITDEGKISTKHEGKGTLNAVYTDFALQQTKAPFSLDVQFFPFSADNIKKIAGNLTYNEEERSIKLSISGQAGWVYDNGIDLSDYRYLVVKLKEPQECKASVRIYATTSTSSGGYNKDFGTETTLCIDLKDLKYSTNKIIDPSKIRIIAFRLGKTGTIYVDDVYVTNDEVEGIDGIRLQEAVSQPVYNLQGMKVGDARQWQQLKHGAYVVGGKIICK